MSIKNGNAKYYILYSDFLAGSRCRKQFTHAVQILPFIQSLPRHSAPPALEKIENQKVALTTFISTSFVFATLNTRFWQNSIFHFQKQNQFQTPPPHLGFRYVNTRIAANQHRLRVYATEWNSACDYKKGGNLSAFVYAKDLFWDINL